MSLAARTQAYEAACKRKPEVPIETPGKRTPDKQPPELPKKARHSVDGAAQASPSNRFHMGTAAGMPAEPEAPQRALRKLSFAASIPVEPEAPRRPLRALSEVPEQRALKMGLLKLEHLRVADQELQPAELPRCASGAPKVVQSSGFLRRLLTREVEFKSCMETDVSSAQPDLRHLRMEQLLSIRSPTLDFATESQSHSARNSFLETVDKHLFDKLAQDCLRGSAAPARPEVMHALGIRIALTIGAAELIEAGWTRPSSTGPPLEVPPIPPCWAIKLKREEWPDGCQAAVFNTDELWVEPLPGSDPNFAKATSGGPLAVPCDRTTGIGKDRMLHWEIAVLDPGVDDVLAELLRNPKERAVHQLTGSLADELAATLTHRSVKLRTS